MPLYPVLDSSGKPTGKVDAVIYLKGERYRKRCRSEAEAYAWLADILKESPPEPDDRKRIRLDEFLPRYLGYCRTEKSYETNRKDTGRLRIFREWCRKKQIEYLDQITPALVETFKQWYLESARGQKNPRQTYNRYLQLLKAMLNWAVMQGFIKVNPIAGVKLLKDTQKRFFRIYSKDELEVIFRLAPSPYGAYFQLLYYTGMRDGEARYLEWSDIDLKKKVIKIQAKEGFHPKNYQTRIIPIHPRLTEVLEGLPRSGKYVFDDGTGGHKFSNSWALRVLKNILKLNDLPDGRIHDFRHTFCSHLVEAGVDLQTVKDLAGHQSISTTEKYTHSRPERRVCAIQKLWK